MRRAITCLRCHDGAPASEARERDDARDVEANRPTRMRAMRVTFYAMLPLIHDVRSITLRQRRRPESTPISPSVMTLTLPIDRLSPS